MGSGSDLFAYSFTTLLLVLYHGIPIDSQVNSNSKITPRNLNVCFRAVFTSSIGRLPSCCQPPFTTPPMTPVTSSGVHDRQILPQAHITLIQPPLPPATYR